jgi:hypothetical protein
MTAEHRYVPLQPWSCDKCKCSGRAEIPDGTDIWSGYKIIREAHREACPECHAKWGSQYVRVKQTAPIPD